MTPRDLGNLYRRAHNCMRNIDGLQPQEAFDELLKYLFLKQCDEEAGIVDGGETASPDGAARLRQRSCQYWEARRSLSAGLWKDAGFRLSDNALLSLHELLARIALGQLSFDIRSAALKCFLTPELRRGLGIFLTPDDVARMMVEFVAPPPGARVYDPACGSGTFLIEILRSWCKSAPAAPLELWASDVNPRMLLLAELNLGHQRGVVFQRQVRDALAEWPAGSWPQPETFDVILTNPPFGVVIDSAHYVFSRFLTCRLDKGGQSHFRADADHLSMVRGLSTKIGTVPREGPLGLRERQSSEVVFIEQCLRLLRPGGVLGIVLPKSVITNATLAAARSALDRLGHVYAAVSLPPETFATTGAQTTTAVLFFRRHAAAAPAAEDVSIVHADVRNVGYDATGRPRAGNELPLVGKDMRAAAAGQGVAGICRLLPAASADGTLSALAGLISQRPRASAAVRLGEVAEVIRTGRTPARAAYQDSGLFIVKVGNLTGQGISWLPRDRNFVSAAEAEKRRRTADLMLDEHDILLTSSAHSPAYIAKKVDIVTQIPESVGGQATFVGETLLVRLKSDSLDPFVLLAFLRRPETIRRLQQMVRGQTAHLMPADVAEMELPAELFHPQPDLRQTADLLKEEAALALELSRVSARIEAILSDAIGADRTTTP